MCSNGFHVVTTPHHSSESVEEAAKKAYPDNEYNGTRSLTLTEQDVMRMKRRCFAEGASFQSLQGKASKTLDECKQEIATKYNCDDWNMLLFNSQFSDTELPKKAEIWDELCELYALSSTSVTEGEPIKYDIDFGPHVRAGIELTGEIKFLGAVDGWGNGIPLDQIKISPSPNTK